MMKNIGRILSGISIYSLSDLKRLNFDENDKSLNQRDEKSAISVLLPYNSNVSGLVSFNQKNYSSQVKVVANISGLNPNDQHDIYIHEMGDLTNIEKSLGKYYSAKNTEEFNGKLALLKTDEKGNGFYAGENKHISLLDNNSIIGRSIAVKEAINESNGQPPRSISVGIIGICDKFKNFPP